MRASCVPPYFAPEPRAVLAGEVELNGCSAASLVPAGGFGDGVLGDGDGLGLGDFEGVGVGDFVGVGLGDFDGVGLGDFEGVGLGAVVGFGLGDFVGLGELDSSGSGVFVGGGVFGADMVWVGEELGTAARELSASPVVAELGGVERGEWPSPRDTAISSPRFTCPPWADVEMTP